MKNEIRLLDIFSEKELIDLKKIENKLTQLNSYDYLNPFPFIFPLRLGRKQQRAILDNDSKEVVVFPKGMEEVAKITVVMWNDWHKKLAITQDVKCNCAYCS